MCVFVVFVLRDVGDGECGVEYELELVFFEFCEVVVFGWEGDDIWMGD